MSAKTLTLRKSRDLYKRCAFLCLRDSLSVRMPSSAEGILFCLSVPTFRKLCSSDSSLPVYCIRLPQALSSRFNEFLYREIVIKLVTVQPCIFLPA